MRGQQKYGMEFVDHSRHIYIILAAVLGYQINRPRAVDKQLFHLLTEGMYPEENLLIFEYCQYRLEPHPLFSWTLTRNFFKGQKGPNRKMY